MKITDIKAYTMDAFRTNWTFIKVETDEGLYGWGEASLGTREHALEGCVDDMKRMVVGRNPIDIEKMWFEVYRDSYWKGGPVMMSALSGIEIACWDIAGKFYNAPVCNLRVVHRRAHAGAVRREGEVYRLQGREGAQVGPVRQGAHDALPRGDGRRRGLCGRGARGRRPAD